MIQRLKYWILQRGKHCKYCCLWCEYYDLCKNELTHERRQIRAELPDGRGIVIFTQPWREKKAEKEAVKAWEKERRRRENEKF